MKWKGMVSQLGHSSIAARFAPANANHASSTELRRSESITAMPHRLDGSVLAELLPEPPDADLDDVRTRIEVVAPDVREQPLPAHDLAFVAHQVVEEPELAVGERGDHVAELRLTARDVEREHPRAHGRPGSAARPRSPGCACLPPGRGP